MAQAAQKIDHAASTIEGLRQRLEGHKTAVLGGWQGNAATAFDRVFQDFNADFLGMLKELNTLHEHLVHNRIRYESTEQEQTDAAKAINALLNH